MNDLALSLLIDSAVKSMLVLLLAAGLTRALRGASAAGRHLVWLAAIGVCLLLPVASTLLPTVRLPVLSGSPAVTAIVAVPTVWPMSHPAQATEVPDDAQIVPAPRPRLLPLVGPAIARPFRAAAVPAVIATPARGSAIWPSVVIECWLLGAAVVMLSWLIGVAAVWRLARKTAAITHGRVFDEAVSIQAELKLNRQVVVRVGPAVRMPIASGAILPCVLLPASAEAWPVEQLRSVLLHELAHVKRMDCAAQWLAQIATAVYWFNPLMWIAASRLRSERERACDDMVLSHGASPTTYAEHLLAIAQAFAGRSLVSTGAVAMARPSGLKNRVCDILQLRMNRRPASLRLAIGAAAAAGVLLIPLASVKLAARAAATQPVAAPVSQPVASTADLIKAIRQRKAPDKRAQGVAQLRQMLSADPATQASALIVLARTSDIPFDHAGLSALVVKLLRSPSPAVRTAALTALYAVHPDPACLPDVVAMAKDPDVTVRREVMGGYLAVAQSGQNAMPPPIGEPALTLLGDADREVVINTAQRLWGFAITPEVEAKVIELSKYPPGTAPAPKSIQYWMMYFVMSTRPQVSLPVAQRLSELANDPSLDENWHQRVIWGLGNHECSPAAEAVVTAALIQEVDNSLIAYDRDCAVRGLGQLHTAAAAAKLADLAEHDESKDVREQAKRFVQPKPEPHSDAGEQGPSLATVPPVVVATTPAAGVSDVDPSLTRLAVTFSKTMTDRSWSWVQTSDDTFPALTGTPAYAADHRTCTLPVKLKPKQSYAIWINSNDFQNFVDDGGRPAVPYLLMFRTR